jgi:uncharacterized protein (DUF486 family)
MFRAAILLIISNLFMTFAWYGHLRHTQRALWLVVLVSWGIAFFEYCFQVPANRIGYIDGISGAQLKTLQEVITLAVFVVFAVWYLKEPIRWNVVLGFVFVALGATLVFAPWSRPASARASALESGQITSIAAPPVSGALD